MINEVMVMNKKEKSFILIELNENFQMKDENFKVFVKRLSKLIKQYNHDFKERVNYEI
jgi:hypothetical protein